MKALIHMTQITLQHHVTPISKNKWRSLFLKRILAKMSTSALITSTPLLCPLENSNFSELLDANSSSVDYFDFSSFEE